MSPKDALAQIPNYLKYMTNIKSCSPHTLRAYKRDLTHIFDPVNSSKTTINDLRSFLSAQLVALGKLSLATRNRKIGCLKSFLNWLYETRLIDTALSESFHSPKVPRKMPHFISFDEVISCLEYLKNRTKALDLIREIHNRQQRLLFLLLYGAGLRISEGCSLKFRDLFESERKILIQGKGNKERYVVCPEFVWLEWTSYRKFLKENHSLSLKNEFVFFHISKLSVAEISSMKAINTRTGYSWIRSLGAATGLTQNLNPHALRHSFATHLLNSGANLRVIQSLLGHATLAATEKYTHLNLTQLYNTMEQSHPLGNAQAKESRKIKSSS